MPSSNSDICRTAKNIRPNIAAVKSDFCQMVSHMTDWERHAEASHAFDDLVGRYSNPTNKHGSRRQYHSFDHVLDCIGWIRAFYIHECGAHDALLEHASALWMAILYHDCVYITDDPSICSEVESAAVALRALSSLGFSYKFVTQVVELILATHHARPNLCGENGELIRAIDLHNFGTSLEEFRKTSPKVESEYGHVPRRMFLEGRIKFMNGLIASGRVYEHPFFFANMEEAAQRNLRDHVDDLKRELADLK